MQCVSEARVQKRCQSPPDLDHENARVHENTNVLHDHASEQMDPLRQLDWESEDVSELGIRRPCRVPHDVLDGLHVSGLVFPKVGWY
jgi:hypothetical protein